MSGRTNLIRRRAELEKEIQRLEGEIQHHMLDARSQAIQEVHPTTLLKKFPLQAIAAVAVAGITSIFVSKGLHSSFQKHRSVREDPSSSSESTPVPSQTASVSSSPSLKQTLRSELQQLLVHQIVKGVSSYVDQAVREKKLSN